MLTVAHATLPPPSRETDRRERERREDRGSPVLFLAYRVVSVALLALLPHKTEICRFPVFAVTCEAYFNGTSRLAVGYFTELSQYLQRYKNKQKRQINNNELSLRQVEEDIKIIKQQLYQARVSN